MYLKLSSWLEIIAFKLRQKSLYFKLAYYLKHNIEHFENAHYLGRGIGKTYTLIKLAQKFKCPIVVSSIMSADSLRRKCRSLKLNIDIIICNGQLRGKMYDKVLCEEDVNLAQINEVLKPACKCIVGFIIF